MSNNSTEKPGSENKRTPASAAQTTAATATITPEVLSASLAPELLAHCEREPIHIPGSIQPQGALLGFDPATGVVLYASTNLSEFLPLSALPAQGRALVDLLGPSAFARVQQGLIRCSSGLVRHEIVELPARPSEKQALDLDGLLHVHRGVGMLEIEAAPRGQQGDWAQRLSETIDALRSAADLDELCHRMAQRVKHLTNFDRVMVYRFDERWDGHVIADVHEPDMESFYDLHYPASDIPAQARELYCSNLVRFIADMAYQPVPVLPQVDNDRMQPLDMSHASLRSVSPMHVRYMQNMGVASTLTISLLVDNQLWGLIACHHRTATSVPIKLRRACYSLAVTAGYMTGWFVEQQRQRAAAEASQAQARIVEAFNQVQVPLADVVEHSTTWLLRLVGATGGALWRNDAVIPFGHWPAGARGESIMRYLRSAFETRADDWIATDELRLQPPLSADELHALCGVLAVRFDAFANSGIVWLRPETRRGVSWGGDPDKPVQVEINGNGQPVLSPRSSFARWTTLVKGRSRPWTDSDRDAARSLLVLQQVLVVRDSLAQVHVSDRQFRSLVALQSEAYWQLDQDGRIVTMSKRLPFAHGPLNAARLVDVFADVCNTADVLALSDALDGSRPFRGLRLSGRDHAHDQTTGNTFVVSLNGEPIRDAVGPLTGWHGTITDVTHEAKMEQVMQQKAAAELASQTKSNFLSQISHELRTPLNVIIGFSQMALFDPSTPTPQRERMQQVFEAGNWLLTMISDLLDLSRIESGRLQLTMADVDVNALLHEAVSLLQPQANEQSIRIVLPSSDKDAAKRVRADATRLKQVLVNLLSNAIKYNRPQGEVRVVFSTQPSTNSPHGTTRIDVSDTGEGLTQAQLEHLFEPFNRLGRESQKVTGTGIGLVIAKELVEHMGGSIEVHSTPGIGSCFAVVLDASASDAATDGSSDSASDSNVAKPTAAAAASTPPLVLYVEDEPGNERLMRELAVSLLGFRYDHAVNAEDGLELARAIRPNVMLIDRNLPGQDGLWLLHALREDPALQGIPCIAVTADVTEQTRAELLDAGFDQVWHKPIDVAAVCRALKALTS